MLLYPIAAVTRKLRESAGYALQFTNRRNEERGDFLNSHRRVNLTERHIEFIDRNTIKNVVFLQRSGNRFKRALSFSKTS